MTLTDLAPKEKWIELQNELHDKFNFNADVMDADGKRLAGNTWGNTLCAAIRDDDKGRGAICVPAGQMFIHMLQTTKEPIAEFCDGGMMRISVPIMKDDEMIGFAGGCGLAPDDDEVDEFTIGMMSGLSEEDIAEKAKTVSQVSEAQVAEIQAYITKRVQELIG